MLPNDLICRAVVYPKFVRNDIFDEEQLLTFRHTDESKKKYVLSVASKYLLRDSEGVHRFGSKVASALNEHLKKRYDTQPPPLKISYYLGFYELLYGDAIKPIYGDAGKPNPEFYFVSVRNKPENGSVAHFEIELTKNAHDCGARQARNDRKQYVSFLSSRLIGPELKQFSPDQTQLIEHQKLLPIKVPAI